jgi:hypothetical protein
VDLVEDNQRLTPRPASFPDLAAVLAPVPGEVQARAFGSEDLLRKSRFPDLARASQEDHLVLEVSGDGWLEVAVSRHGEYFSAKAKKVMSFFAAVEKKSSRPVPGWARIAGNAAPQR